MKKYTKYPCAFHLTKKTVIRNFFLQNIIVGKTEHLSFNKAKFHKHFYVSNREFLERGDVQCCLGAACV